MKKLMTAVVFATLIAAPVYAQSYDPSVGSGNTVPPPYSQTTNYTAPAEIATQSTAVVVNGKVVGHDPDAFIRLQLEREAESGRP